MARRLLVLYFLFPENHVRNNLVELFHFIEKEIGELMPKTSFSFPFQMTNLCFLLKFSS